MQHASSLSGTVDQRKILVPQDRSKCPLHVFPSIAWREEGEKTDELFSPHVSGLKSVCQVEPLVPLREAIM